METQHVAAEITSEKNEFNRRMRIPKERERGNAKPQSNQCLYNKAKSAIANDTW